MNQELYEPDSQDVLDRATAALRNVAVPEAPGREEMADVLERVSERANAGHWKRYYKPSLAAAAAAVLICSVASWLLFGNTRVVFADALQRLRESQTISFRTTAKGEAYPLIVTRHTMAEPGLVRIRMQMDGKDAGVSIFDGQASAGIILMPATKQAIKMTSADDLPDQASQSSEFIQWLKTTQEHSVEDLGPRKIDGVATFGFRVEKEGQPWNVWVDLQSNLPVRMETQIAIAGLSAAVVMDEFVFDEELHPSLFSLTPPPGYTVTQELEVREPGEQDVVDFLQHVAEMTDGTFPPDLEIQTLIGLAKTQPKDPSKDDLQTTLVLTRALMFLQMNGVTYTGSGVKLGDAESILCWWTPKGKETFRAVYADLTIRDGDAKEPPSS